nr:MAG TPA: hypothetical protein [Caudoviricetes sp.]
MMGHILLFLLHKNIHIASSSLSLLLIILSIPQISVLLNQQIF